MTDELTRLFDAERAVQPPGGDMQRGLGRLLGDVARGVAPLPVAATSLKLGLSLASKWLAVGFVVGIGGAGAAARIWAPHAAAAPSAHVQAVLQPSPLPRMAAMEPPAPSGNAASIAAPEVAAVRVAGRAAPSASSAESPAAAAPHLDEEMRLIAAAKRELEQGKPQLAGAWLTEHAARFPNGVFASERDALRILLRCGEHREPQLAERFVASHPSSPIAERLIRACSSAPAPNASAVDFPKSTND